MAQRALSPVATDESEVRRFVEALATAGDRAAAIRFYEKFAEQLRAEYEVEPAPETVQLVDVLRNRTFPSERSQETERSAVLRSPIEADATPDLGDAGSAAAGIADRSPNRVRWWVAAIALTALVVSALVLASVTKSSRSDEVFVPNRVVVSLFENHTGDSTLAPLALLAANWISDGLARPGMVEVITPTGVRNAYEAAANQGTPWSGRHGIVTLAEKMHAGIVVSGQLYLVSNEVMVRAEVNRMPNMAALGTIDPLPLPTTDPGPTLDTLRQRVMGLLAIHLDPRLADWAATVERPPTYDAYREFVAGLGLLSAPRIQLGVPTREEQLEQMLKAAALDSSFMAPLIRALRLKRGDYDVWQEFCDSVMQILERRQHLLTPVERYEIEALAARPADWIGAYQAMRRAADLAPDRLNELATSAMNAGRYAEAVEILERPDLPLGLGPYPWHTLTVSLHFLGEHERELDAARRARRENSGHRMFMVMEITALAALGRFEDAEATMRESQLTGRTVEGNAPMGWGEAAAEFLWHGYEREGLEMYDRIVTYIRAQPVEVQNQSALAHALRALGRFQEALPIYERIVEGARGITWQYELALSDVAYAAAGTGDLETVHRIDAELEAGEGPQAILAWNVFHRSQIAGVLGDCGRAVELLDEALNMGVSHTMIHRRFGFMNCRDYPAFTEIAKPRG